MRHQITPKVAKRWWGFVYANKLSRRLLNARGGFTFTPTGLFGASRVKALNANRGLTFINAVGRFSVHTIGGFTLINVFRF